MMSPETLCTCLESVVGSNGVWMEDSQTTAFAINARRPVVVVRPETVEQAAEIVMLAGREHLAVVPWGQGTQMSLGQVPQRYDLALSLPKPACRCARCIVCQCRSASFSPWASWVPQPAWVACL
jgi:hypothetical protein